MPASPPLRPAPWLPTAGLLVAMACAPDGALLTEAGELPPTLAKGGGGKPGGDPPPPAPLPGVCGYDMAPEVLPQAGWSPAFAEEFDGAAVDGGRWSAWYGGAWNEELQLYRPANLSVASGVLAIAARREAATGPTHPWDATPRSYDFTSGRIESLAHFSASPTTPRVRLSARIRLPAGIGMWPAFWSYGDPWPTQGEIDVMEGRGSEPFQYQTAYWWGRREGVNQVRNSAKVIPTAVSLTDCFHVYEVIWQQNTLTFLLDGQVVDTKSGGSVPNMFGKRQRITLNLAVGGLFFGGLDPATIQPGTMQVDWVRVHTAN